MTVYDSNNFNEEDGSLEYQYYTEKNKYDNVTYSKIIKNFFVISGIHENKIYYIKQYIGKGSNNILYITYNLTDKERFDKIAEKISKSFIPGNLKQFK